MDMTGGRRKLHEELCNLYTLPKCSRLIRLRFKWAVRIVSPREMNNVY